MSCRPGGWAATRACRLAPPNRGRARSPTTRARWYWPTRSVHSSSTSAPRPPSGSTCWFPPSTSSTSSAATSRSSTWRAGSPTAGCGSAWSPWTTPRRCRGRGSARSSPTAASPGSSTGLEVAFAREEGPLEVNPADRFIATTWWTAHLAHAAMRRLDGERFLYLIQEYEPFTFPMGAFAAVARQSYELPHLALFSSELLRDYFRVHGLGVFSEGSEGGERDSAAFANAITRVEPPSERDLAAGGTRRLLFYARPEPHATRNMFELGILALGRAVFEGVLGPDWELHGVGTVRDRRADRPRRRRHFGDAPSPGPGGLRGASESARRGPRADVHATPQPGPNRDGLGGHADGHEQLREQDRRCDGGDLLQPDRRRAQRRGGLRWAARRPQPASTTSDAAPAAATSGGAATGTSRSTTS